MKRGLVRPLERVLADKHRHYYRETDREAHLPGTVVKKCIHCPKIVVRKKDPS